MTTKTVAVIGAGAAGLTSIKCALEDGLEPTAFEREAWLGGIWRYTDDKTKSCVAYSTVTNTSKHMMCYSDFPMPKEFPNYLPQQLAQKYLEMYASHFGLIDKIRFETEVTSVTPSSDHDSTGRWTVCYRSFSDKKLVKETFDFVMVCSGHYQVPLMPNIQGLDSFEGEVLHSKAYKTWKPFEGKRVLVVGLGNTGADIACELSRHASQVYLSTRRGTWVTSRLAKGGIPLDVAALSRTVGRITELLPRSLTSRILVWRFSSTFDPADFGLQAEHVPPRQGFVINDELPHRIITGSLIVKSDVASVKGKRVILTDQSKIDDIDAIILATGFKMVFPVVGDSLLHPTQAYTPLYKYVFPPTLEKATLALIGAVRVKGPVPVVLEMQARWTCRVFTRKCSLPTLEVMMADILKKQEILVKLFAKSTTVHHLVYSFVEYMDEIGSLFGVTPGFWNLFWQDPGLALKCSFGPCVPAQYRLVGPGAWEGARDVINGVQESMLLPLQTRKVKKHASNGHLSAVLILGALVILFAALIFFP